ncbi:MAG: hypothetical protein AABZ83_11225, partial [candidate division NC10 bacterium]
SRLRDQTVGILRTHLAGSLADEECAVIEPDPNTGTSEQLKWLREMRSGIARIRSNLETYVDRSLDSETSIWKVW